ncbi:MAG TPA: LamG domain-containing protein, partial [Bacteroidales bacterium]|nr:LamG domain-containing protein [Bacteroidales bacterium]
YTGIKINGSFGTDYRISVNSHPSLNTWHHILTQRNGSKFFLYIDGIKISSIDCPSDLLPSTRYTNIGGAWIGTTGAYQQFKGDIDDLRLYDRALSDDEIIYLSKH